MSYLLQLQLYFCFILFSYKERSATNAKMLRDVKFPLSFDAYDLCTKRLQDKLLPMREKFKEIDDAEAAKKMSLEEKEKNKSKTGQVIPFQFADGKFLLNNIRCE